MVLIEQYTVQFRLMFANLRVIAATGLLVTRTCYDSLEVRQCYDRHMARQHYNNLMATWCCVSLMASHCYV